MVMIIFYSVFLFNYMKIIFFLKFIFNINTSNNPKIPKTINFKQKFPQSSH